MLVTRSMRNPQIRDLGVLCCQPVLDARRVPYSSGGWTHSVPVRN